MKRFCNQINELSLIRTFSCPNLFHVTVRVRIMGIWCTFIHLISIAYVVLTQQSGIYCTDCFVLYKMIILVTNNYATCDLPLTVRPPSTIMSASCLCLWITTLCHLSRWIRLWLLKIDTSYFSHKIYLLYDNLTLPDP